jgi:hypothetical protein
MIGEPVRRQPPNRRPKRPLAMLRRRAASGRHPKRCQRMTNDPCPRECPSGSQRRLTNLFVSRHPHLCQVRGLLPWRALRGMWYPGRSERGARLGDSWAGRGEQVRGVSLDDYCSTTSRRQSPCRLLAVRPMNKDKDVPAGPREAEVRTHARRSSHPTDCRGTGHPPCKLCPL